MRGEKKHSPEFYKGVKEAQVNKGNSNLDNLYIRAKEFSAEGVSLPDVEKGYVFGVANNLINKKGKALDAAEFYSVIGELKGSEFKEKVAKALIRDAKSMKDFDYVKEIQTFLETNKMMKHSNRLSLEAQVANPRKKEWIFSLALILLGVLFAGYNITGNVIGNSGFDSLVGGLFFVVGVSFLFFSIKK